MAQQENQLAQTLVDMAHPALPSELVSVVARYLGWQEHLPATYATTAILAHSDTVRCVAWSHDGTRLATASNDGTPRVWSAADGELIAELTGHMGLVTHVAWSPDGARIATASSDYKARVWDAADGKKLAELDGHIENL